MKVSPSILACDFTQMGKEVALISKSGADYIHMDIMDGHFVPNISFGPSIVKALRPATNLKFDVHLMVSDPYKYIENFIDAGADLITFHLESNSDVYKTIQKIKNMGRKVGLALKPETDVKYIVPYIPYLDVVLVMTVEPGFGGQELILNQLEKTKAIKEKILNKNSACLIEIDGGVNLNTIGIIRNYPIDVIVSGTCIFKSSNYSHVIKRLKSTENI